MENMRNEISIVLGGAAGTGIQTIEAILTKTLKQAGLYLFSTKEYMSRIRGGSNSVEIRAADFPVSAFVRRMDIFLPFDRQAFERLEGRCDAETLLIGDPEALVDIEGLFALPLKSLAADAGGKTFANTIASGFLVGLLGVNVETLEAVLGQMFASKGDGILEKNLVAARSGWKVGSQARQERGDDIYFKSIGSVNDSLFMNGSQAVALGAIAGGCNFISSYPMSPSTGVLMFLATQAKEFGIVVEQAEDEISAINMGIGSWYAGGRAMVTTSGGGFALMTEGLSMAGIMESPMVIHLAQRPGPATGLPTKTEQGDLDLALYGGHGEFPRVILTPGTLKDAALCGQYAFVVAEACQVPVFILTDQYLLDSYCDVEEFTFANPAVETQIIETDDNYQRYAFVDGGISPRGIPGFGKGLVRVDSDEHNEGGVISEEPDMRNRMMEKRLGKFEQLRTKFALPPKLFGPRDFTRLVVGWGSTCGMVAEALGQVGDSQTAFLYCPQVFPLSEDVSGFLAQAEQVAVIENNATGQFARLLQRETGYEVDEYWLKYNGWPFSVEEVENLIREGVTYG